MLKKRILTSLIGIPVVIAAVWFQEPIPWFTILVIIWAAFASYEFFSLNKKAGIKSLPYFGIVLAVLFVAIREKSFISAIGTPFSDPMLLLAVAVVVPLVWLLCCGPRNDAFNRWVWTLAGISYVGLLLGYLVALRGLADGRNWILFALLITYASDTAAFFIGRAWGRHKLATAISPSKTWEGSGGGLFGAILISLVFLPSHYFSWANPLHLPGLNAWWAVGLALLVSIAGQLGDLVESLFKRNMGVKDSGNLLPGHGGALDRMDSVVFAGVVVYYFVWLIQ